MGSIPVMGRFPEEVMAVHLIFLLWRILWTENLMGYSPEGGKQSDTTEDFTLTLSLTYLRLLFRPSPAGAS